jgi:serine protease Do
MTQKRLLYLTLIVATLTIGVVIGTIVSGGVKATGEQQKAQTLVIPDPVSLSNAFSQIAANIDPAVVNINTEGAAENPLRGTDRNNPNNRNQREQPDPFDFFNFFGAPDLLERDQPVRNLGTGFIVDKAGYILTNHHVIDKASKIKVRLDDKSEYTAKVVGSDSETDLAVIKIEAGRDLPVARLGNSDAVKVGDWVLAIGSPFSLDHTVTAGIISAKGRENIGPDSRQFQSFLQTDAAINPGNSGGPLVSMSGDVIGVNTAIISGTRQSAGLGFALPSNVAVKVYNQLVQNGKVTRGGIGIQYDGERNAQLCRAMALKSDCGVVVSYVQPGLPAARAGIREDDVITEIDGTKITSPSVLLDVIANTAVGTTARIKINREGKEMTLPVTVVDRTEITAASNTPNELPDRNDRGEPAQGRLGIRVQDITPDVQRQLRLPNAEGVFITAVEPGSAGEEAGLARGMVITSVISGTQRYDVNSAADFRRAETALKSGSEAAIRVLQRNPNTEQYRSGLVPITVP